MRKIMVLVIALAFILAACSGGGSTTGNTRAFLGGTAGLIINFVEGEPPTEVTDGDAFPFTIAIQLENQGESDIAKDDVSVSFKGFDAVQFASTTAALTNIKPSEEIMAADINPDTGARIPSPPVFVTSPELNYKTFLSGNKEFPVVADVCYKYTTQATADICIKENLQDTLDTTVCTVLGAKEIQNSGAPVQVASFEEFSAGQDAVSFTFTVKNMGNGEVYTQGSTCNDATRADEDKVYIEVDTGLSDPLACQGLGDGTKGTIKLSTGQRIIRCTQQITDKVDKISVVTIKLTYDYLESKATSVLVKHVGDN